MGCGTSVVKTEADVSLSFEITTPSLYRCTLSVPEQELYDHILEGYKSFALTLDCSAYAAAKSRKSSNRVNQAILLDHPEIFHTFVESITAHDDKYVLTFAQFNTDIVNAKIEQISDAINSYFKPYYHSQAVMGRAETDISKVQVIIEWILSYGRYEVLPDTEMSQFTIEGFFLKRRSTCDGFAKAYQLLCAMVGIEATCVRGDYSSGWQIKGDSSVSTVFPRDYSPRTIFSVQTQDRFNVHNDVSHQYDHIYGEHEAAALDAVNRQHSEGVLMLPTNMTMTLSSIHRPDSLGDRGPSVQGRMRSLQGSKILDYNADDVNNGLTATGIAISAEDGEVINAKGSASVKGKAKNKKGSSVEDVDASASMQASAPVDVNCTASQVLKSSAQLQAEADLSATGALGNTNVVSPLSKVENNRHAWSMTRIDGVWYHTDLILCLRGMVDSYIPSSFLRMSTAMVTKMGLNIMTLIRIFPANTPVFTASTCVLNSEKSIIADTIKFILMKVEEVKEAQRREEEKEQHQDILFEQSITNMPVADGLQSTLKVSQLTGTSLMPTSVLGSNALHSGHTNAAESTNPLWNHVSMHVGSAMYYDPNVQPSHTHTNNHSLQASGHNGYGPVLNAYVRHGQQAEAQPGQASMQSNYEQWKASRLMALQSAFMSESNCPSVNVTDQLLLSQMVVATPQLGTQQQVQQQVPPGRTYATNTSVFSTAGLTKSAGMLYKTESPVVPNDVMSSLDSVLTFEFVYGMNLDWSVARRIMKGKMPFISTQLRDKGIRIANYTVEKFLTTITLEERRMSF